MSFFVDDNISAPTKEHGAFLELIQSGRIGVRDLRNIANDKEFDRTTRMMAAKEILKTFEMLPLDMDNEIAEFIISNGDEYVYVEFASMLNPIANQPQMPF